MLDKYISKVPFLLYTWIIYNSYMFVAAPIFVLMLGLHLYLYYLIGIFFLIFPLGIFLNPLLFIPTFFFSMIGLLPAIIWWQKQTIIRAWLLALTGFLGGPGILLMTDFFDLRGQKGGIFILIGLNMFYLILYAADIWQKIYYPDCKVANVIREILKGPCINPGD